MLLPPIVVDCSTNCHVNDAMEEIKQFKKIATQDGNVLFFGCYSNFITNHPIDSIFSKMPEEWIYRFDRDGVDENMYKNGLLNRDCMLSIVGAIYVAD